MHRRGSSETQERRDISSHLLRARDVWGFDLGRARVDVRGWQVFAKNSELVGTVNSLFVDVHSKAVRYLGVTLDGVSTKTSARTVLVPVGTADRSRDRAAITLSTLTRSQLVSAPRVSDRPVTRADEDATLRSLGLATSMEVDPSEFYDRPPFNEKALFGDRD